MHNKNIWKRIGVKIKKNVKNQNGKNYEKYVKGVILITDI